MPLLSVSVFVAAAQLLAAAKGVQITRLSMPRWVQNGTEDSVVLDCEYAFSESDDKRLVVKWFLNDDPLPIYQWIPELNQRFASERVRGKLNMDYAVHPSSRHTRYRALNLMRPTTELSGRYSCNVVSLNSQDVEDQVMVVYAPPRSFDLNVTRSSSSLSNLSCEADGVFPLPKMSLARVAEDDGDVLLDAADDLVHESIVQSPDGGAFRVVLWRIVVDREMRGRPAVYECVLSIPGTDYQNMRRFVYHPGSISGTWRPRQPLLLLLLVLLFCACS